MPGVSTGASDQLYIGATNPLGTNVVSFAINGQRNSANYWTIDGADNVDRGSNLTLLNYPSIDSLAEFKVLRGLYTAEFGRSGGGQINVVTKSGTNQFHGNAYEFVRNNAFAANNWWSNAQRLNLGSDGKANVPPLRYNDFGYTFGGPIYIPGKFNKDKNKTFFFSQEFRRVITYATISTATATDNEKKGIFATPVCINNTGSTCNQTTTQITNINPVAAAYIQDIFSKVPGSNPADHLLSFNARSVYNARQELIRIDHMFNEKFSVWGRMLNDSIPTTEPGGLFQGGSYLPGVGITNTNAPGRTWVFHANLNLHPNVIMEGGYNKSYGAITSEPVGLDASANSPDIKVNLPFAVTLGRVPSVGFGISGYGPYRDYNRNNSAYDNLTWIKGRHTVKFGASINRYQKTENNGGNNVGSFAFPSTANPAGTPTIAQQWANFLLGNVSNFTQNSLDVTPDVRAWQWEAYAQDDFRVRSNLTFSLGLRYSFFGQPWDENKMLTNFDPSLWSASKAPQVDAATGNLVAGTGDLLNGISINNQTSPYGKKIANNSKKDFAPRLGLAWDPFGKGRTSIRTGYGVYYDAMLFGVYEQNIFNNIPYVQSVAIPNTRLENPTAGTPSVSLSPKVIRGTPVPYSTPYVQQWSFGIQQQVGASGLLDVSYVGTKGTHLLGIVDINEVPVGAGLAAGLHTGAGTAFTSADTPKLNALRPYRGFNAINTLETAFDSNYHSLQVAFDRRFGSAGTFGFSYTWSHNLTDNQSDRSNAPQNSYNWHNGEYGPAALDRRHVVTFNYTYELPFFRNASAAPRLLLAGWQISGTTQIGSGTPISAATSATDPAGLGILGSSAAGPRPDMICDPNQGAPHTILQWFNTACFADVPAGQVRPGNAGRGTILGPGYQNWNLSLFKNLHFNDRLRMQLRGEAFNFINHPNPFAPTATITSTLYGKITSFHDPRIIQLGVKLYF